MITLFFVSIFFVAMVIAAVIGIIFVGAIATGVCLVALDVCIGFSPFIGLYLLLKWLGEKPKEKEVEKKEPKK